MTRITKILTDFSRISETFSVLSVKCRYRILEVGSQIGVPNHFRPPTNFLLVLPKNEHRRGVLPGQAHFSGSFFLRACFIYIPMET